MLPSTLGSWIINVTPKWSLLNQNTKMSPCFFFLSGCQNNPADGGICIEIEKCNHLQVTAHIHKVKCRHTNCWYCYNNSSILWKHHSVPLFGRMMADEDKTHKGIVVQCSLCHGAQIQHLHYLSCCPLPANCIISFTLTPKFTTHCNLSPKMTFWASVAWTAPSKMTIIAKKVGFFFIHSTGSTREEGPFKT